MRFQSALLASLVPALLLAQAPASPGDRVAAWREDLAVFAQKFPPAQFEFQKLYPRSQFDRTIDALTNELPTATDADIVLGLMRLVGSAHVAHTSVRLPTSGPLTFHRLPISLQWLSDGLVVTAATEPYLQAIGLRVTHVGALTPEQLEAAVAPFIAFERDSWLRVQSQTYMVAEEVLRAVGQIDPDGRVALTLARPDGSPLMMRVAAVPWSERPAVTTVTAVRNLPVGPAQRDPSRYYRWEILTGTTTLYVRYSRCQDDPQQSFAAFAKELFEHVDSDPRAVDRVIVDLRANGGGNSTVIKPLLDGLRARGALSKRGHLYALIGPSTFSSGLLAAWSLKQLHAVLVGEAPGENLNSYAEVRELTLPHSGVVVVYSTKYNHLGKDGQTLEPDLRVTRSMDDVLIGRDPVLEAAMRR